MIFMMKVRWKTASGPNSNGTKLGAERQTLSPRTEMNTPSDFAFYCETGKLDVETDGDQWAFRFARSVFRRTIAGQRPRNQRLETAPFSTPAS